MTTQAMQDNFHNPLCWKDEIRAGIHSQVKGSFISNLHRKKARTKWRIRQNNTNVSIPVRHDLYSKGPHASGAFLIGNETCDTTKRVKF